jgi:peptidoglycan/LPS O-acetylase OafA/YrhL
MLINIISLVIASASFIIALIGHHEDAQFIAIAIIFPALFIVALKKTTISEKSHLFLKITSIVYLLGTVLLLAVCILEVQGFDLESIFNEDVFYGIVIGAAIVILLTALIFDKKRNRK